MPLPKILNDGTNTSSAQHLTVFGESGSGKTVLVSSFYGHMTEPSTIGDTAYRVTARDASQHTSLRKNYLGMRELNRAPQATRFKTTSYDFLIRINQPNDPDSDKAPAPKEMSLVWHDYPGEWLETTPETPEEKQRQKDTIASLMGSDVALLLIDASRLTTDPDTQARYLKSVLGNYRETIQRMRQDLLPNGRQAAGQFPAHLGSHPFEGGPAARHHCLRLRRPCCSSRRRRDQPASGGHWSARKGRCRLHR